MSFWDYLDSNYEFLIELGIEHIQLVLIAMGIATALGVPLGIVAHRSNLLRSPILSSASFFLTIPSLALFGLFIPVFGLGTPPAVAALTLYALLPIIGNTVAGLSGVTPSLVKASRGMGLSPWRQLWQVEMPLAWPVIVTGIRVATQVTVGIAAIAVLVGGPGLGNEIFRGIRSSSPDRDNLIYGGTLAIFVIALVFDAIFVLFQKLTTSKGIR